MLTNTALSVAWCITQRGRRDDCLDVTAVDVIDQTADRKGTCESLLSNVGRAVCGELSVGRAPRPVSRRRSCRDHGIVEGCRDHGDHKFAEPLRLLDVAVPLNFNIEE